MSNARARTEVRGEIHGLAARRHDALNPWRRGAVRQRAEDQVAAVEIRVVVGDELHVVASEARALSAPLVGAGEMQTEPRMARDERAELAAGVPGRAQDSNGNFMHGE
jgi:hypothetical protein